MLGFAPLGTLAIGALPDPSAAQQIGAAVTGTAAAAMDATRVRPVAADVQGVATTALAYGVGVAVAAAPVGVATSTLDTIRVRPVAVDAQGIATATGFAGRIHGEGGSAAGVATASFGPTITAQARATASGVATATAMAQGNPLLLQASATGVATATATIRRIAFEAAAVLSSGSATCAVAVYKLLAADVVATATAEANATSLYLDLIVNPRTARVYAIEVNTWAVADRVAA